MMQIYGYSLSIFIPLGFLHCLLYPLARLRLLTTILGSIFSLYYIYKETREMVIKYLEGADDTTYWYMKVFAITSTIVFALLFRYYFLEA